MTITVIKINITVQRQSSNLVRFALLNSNNSVHLLCGKSRLQVLAHVVRYDFRRDKTAKELPALVEDSRPG